MALTKEDLQAIGSLMDGMREELRGDIAELKQGQAATNARLDKLEQGQAKLEQDNKEIVEHQLFVQKELQDIRESQKSIRQSQLKVEAEELPRIAAALDGYKLNYEKNQKHDERITLLEHKVDNYSTRVSAVELALKAK